MKKIIACLNLKGGCGKSSTIVNIGGILAEDNIRPLLIDLDAQMSATQWAKQGGKDFPFPVIPLSVKTAGKVRAEIEKTAAEHNADVILIDTPPQLEDDALIAALLADIVLIPVSPSPLDLWAAEQAVKTIREAREERGGELPRAVLIPSRVLSRTTIGRDIEETLKSFGEPVSPPICLRVAMAESAIAGLPISKYAPKSPSHKEFINLWKFVNAEIRK